MEKRQYQLDAIKAIKDGYSSSKKSGVLCVPTGGGKTYITLRAIQDMGVSTLWVAHRKELLRQAKESAEALGLTVSREDSDEDTDIKLCSSMSNHKLKKWEYDLIVVDECHHQACKTYENIRDKAKYNYYLGLSATPTRLDGKELGFDEIIYQISSAELIKLGHLAKPKYYRLITGEKSNLVKHNKDFTVSSLKSLDRPSRNKFIVKWMKEKGSNWLGPTLVFAINIDHAETVKTMLSKAGFNTKVAHSKTKPEDRDNIIDWVNKTKNPVLVNCELYVEGFDAPRIKSVVLMRPTASKVLYNQMWGRGARVIKDADGTAIKDKFNIVDLVDMHEMYSVLSAEWMLELEADVEEGKEDFDEVLAEDEENIEDKIKDFTADLEGIPKAALDKARMLEVEFAGFLTYGSKFWKRHRVIALTKPQVDALEKLQRSISKWKADVDHTYALCCPNKEFKVQDWIKIAWAYVFKNRMGKHTFSGRNSNITYQLDKMPDVRKSLKKTEIDTALAAAKTEVDKLQKEYHSNVKKLWRRVCSRAKFIYGTDMFLDRFVPKQFDWKVLHVLYKGHYKYSKIQEERNIIEEMMHQVTGECVGLRVRFQKEE